MNWLHYLLEANLYLAVFYAGYYLFLSKETYYTLNRFYLLLGGVMSFILPVVQLGMLKPVERQVTAVHFSFPATTTTIMPVNTTPIAPVFTWDDAIMYAYLLGAAMLFLVLLFKLYQLFKLTRSQNTGSDGQYKVIYLDQSDTAFSFFNYLFIGTKVDQAEMIIKHELVHIRQKHSADVIFIELLKIVNWFNPFIYLMQHSLRAIHEYIADEKTATAGTDTIAYSSFLVNNAYGLSGSPITHSFFNYNLLKKRIIMLHQKRSGSLARLKYLLALPICGGLLCASTLAFSKTYGWVDIAPHHLYATNTGLQTHTAKDTDKNHIPPPPPSAPPVKRIKFLLPNPMTQHTAKGYYYSEAGYMNDIIVTIKEKNGSLKEYDKDKSTASELTMLKDKYGYVFPAHLRRPPPPPVPPVIKSDGHPSPPAQPANAKIKRYPPPVVVADTAINGHKLPVPTVKELPPPPPPAPPKPTAYTKKGYKYSEDGYLIDGKTDFRVIIFEKNGNQLAFFKSKALFTDLNLLKEKYGYTFPAMDIHSKMPPPPPTAPVKTDSKNTKQISRNEAPDSFTLNGITFTRNRPTNYVAVHPLFVINGIKYYTIGDMPHQHFSFGATDSTTIYKDDALKLAVKKLGPDALHGALYLYGKIDISIINN
jgi:hypothetical protein